MKVDNLFRFILSCWNFLNQITSYNAIDIFTIFSDLSTHLEKLRKCFLNVGNVALVWIQKNVHLWSILELFEDS
jgi:hypothetical protein